MAEHMADHAHIVLNHAMLGVMLGYIIADITTIIVGARGDEGPRDELYIATPSKPYERNDAQIPYHDPTRQRDAWFGPVDWMRPGGGRNNRPCAHVARCKGDMVNVRDTQDGVSDKRALALLCHVHGRSAILLDFLKSQYDNGDVHAIADFPTGSGRDIRQAVKRLLDRHRDRLKLSEYFNPDPEDMVVAMNVNKGEELAVCVREKRDPTKLNCVNTMMRVVLHEFAHTMDPHYRMNAAHGPCFDRLADYLYVIGASIDVIDMHGNVVPLYHCPYSCDGTDGELKTHIPFCGLMLPRTHCPSDNDPSPTADDCDETEGRSIGTIMTDAISSLATGQFFGNSNVA
jgi:hypothetical protein